MTDDEIVSPPYPVDTTTVPSLLRHLSKLREWLLDMGPWANTTVADAHHDDEDDVEPVVPDENKIPVVPSVEAYHMVSIFDIVSTLIATRKLREAWDSTIREYETNWGHPKCIVSRLQCIRGAYLILLDAFISPEMREARREKEQRNFQKFTKKMLKKMGVPEEMLRGQSGLAFGPNGAIIELQQRHPGSVNYDELFHGKDSEGVTDDDDDDN